jgi:hypothetical protein
MKTLSEQLAEVLGIKPIYKYEHGCSKCQEYYKRIESASKKELIKELLDRNQVNLYTKKDYESRYGKPVYPDFEQDENFVKLLEVMFLYDFNFERKQTYKESILNTAISEAKVNEEFRKDCLKGSWIY